MKALVCILLLTSALTETIPTFLDATRKQLIAQFEGNSQFHSYDSSRGLIVDHQSGERSAIFLFDQHDLCEEFFYEASRESQFDYEFKCLKADKSVTYVDFTFYWLEKQISARGRKYEVDGHIWVFVDRGMRGETDRYGYYVKR